MKIVDLFTTYWSQVTLILLGVAYFIKRWFDNKSKKIEINHSIYQQHRIIAINDFLDAYSKVEQMWSHLEIYEIFRNDLSAKDIDKIIFPPLNGLTRSSLVLRIYFSNNQYENIKKIVDNMYSINSELSRLYFNDAQMKIVEKVNKYNFHKEKMIKENDALLAEFIEVIKNTYKSYPTQK